jgi:pimeloyl-ACP methyl ester carboxylesterase
MTAAWRQMMQDGLGFEGPGSVDFERIAQTNPDLIKTLQEKHDVFHEPGYWKTLLTAASHYWLSPPQYTSTDFARITTPVLFWSGDRDELCPPEQSLEMYRMVKGAELALIPNADHFTMFAQQELAIGILLNFMQRVTEAA